MAGYENSEEVSEVSITQKKEKKKQLRRCDSPLPDLFHLVHNS